MCDKNRWTVLVETTVTLFHKKVNISYLTTKSVRAQNHKKNRMSKKSYCMIFGMFKRQASHHHQETYTANMADSMVWCSGQAQDAQE